MTTTLKGTIGGGLTFTASPATKNSFTMTAGYEVVDNTDGDGVGWWYEYYGFFKADGFPNCGTINPANIDSFKILCIGNEVTTLTNDSGVDNTNYSDIIRTNHKCILHINGKDYSVTRRYKEEFWEYPANFDKDFLFTEDEKVEITYELL